MFKFPIIFLQRILSWANTCHCSVSIPAFLSVLYNDLPYVYLGDPRGRLDLTQQEIIFRGSRLQGMRMTWPAQRSCCLAM